MQCPASVPLGARCPDAPSTFADEGTAAHFLAAQCLERSGHAADFVGRTIILWTHPESDSRGEAFHDEMFKGSGVDPCLEVTNRFEVTGEMAANVQLYVDYVRDVDGTKMIEQPLLLEEITGEPGAKGTADAVILLGGTLTIVDLKYGRGVKVDAEGNEQLQLYALAALELFDFAGPFHLVRLVIVQPRLGHLDTWVHSVAELRAFKQMVARSAQRGMDAVKAYGNAGGLSQEHFAPGEKPCRFCRAKAVCPALADHALATVADDFVDVTSPVVPQIKQAMTRVHDNATLARLLEATDLIESWCRAIRDEARTQLLSGETVPGYKLVEGRRGARRWKDDKAAEAMLKRMRVKVDHIYERSLISPTTAEKLHKAGTLGDRQWFLVQDLIDQADGKPSVVPASDKRPALILQDDASQFQDLTQ
ncbi:MAG TPA: DUF2800 domain-containing protein [Xylella sp.]